MSDYISRQETIESINYITNDANCPLFIAAALFQVVSEIPAADVRPVVRGGGSGKGRTKALNVACVTADACSTTNPIGTNLISVRTAALT